MLFCLGILKGQNLQDLKNEKSIFIIYDTKDKNTKKSTSAFANGKISSDTYYYTFINSDRDEDCEPEYFNFWIKYSSYMSFNDYYNKKKTPKFKVSKDFLKINKAKIVDRAFMDSIGYKKTFDLLKNCESIYLIDKQEAEEDNYIVKKAILSFSHEE